MLCYAEPVLCHFIFDYNSRISWSFLVQRCNWTTFHWKWWDKHTSKIRHTKTMNELQMSSYARQYNVLGVETHYHVTANIIRHTMVRQEMMQTMPRDTHLVIKVVGRFWNEIIDSYDMIYISIGFNAFKNERGTMNTQQLWWQNFCSCWTSFVELFTGPTAQSRHHLWTVSTTAEGTPFWEPWTRRSALEKHLLTYLLNTTVLRVQERKTTQLFNWSLIIKFY